MVVSLPAILSLTAPVERCLSHLVPLLELLEDSAQSNLLFHKTVIFLIWACRSRQVALNASTRRKSSKGGTLERKSSKSDLKARPSWALFARINEGSEMLLFREKFSDWPEPGRIIKMKGHESSGEVLKVYYYFWFWYY